MSEIILDFSANTHKNDLSIIDRAVDEIKAVDTGKHEIVFKSQLFTSAGDNIVCSKDSFSYMHAICKESGYKCTSSVFDKESLDFLLTFDIPFVKIANNPDLYWLAGEVPKKVRAYQSYTKYGTWLHLFADDYLACISKYPATLKEYEDAFTPNYLRQVSDHTVGLGLFKKYEPYIWEKHLILDDSTGLDAGPFAITPQELAEIL